MGLRPADLVDTGNRDRTVGAADGLATVVGMGSACGPDCSIAGYGVGSLDLVERAETLSAVGDGRVPVFHQKNLVLVTDGEEQVTLYQMDHC